MGWSQDKYSFRMLLSILMVIQLFVSLTIYWVTSLPSLYFICVLLNYFSNGGLFAVFPGSVTNVFGLKFGPQVYTIILLASIVSSCLNIVMTDVLLPVAGFAACFYLGSFVTILALIVLWRFEEKLDVENLKPWQYSLITSDKVVSGLTTKGETEREEMIDIDE